MNLLISAAVKWGTSFVLFFTMTKSNFTQFNAATAIFLFLACGVISVGIGFFVQWKFDSFIERRKIKKQWIGRTGRIKSLSDSKVEYS